MSPSATPATQNEGHCHQAPHLPRKRPRRQRRQTGPKRVTRASPVPEVPRLPRKTKVTVTKRHVCHTNGRGDNSGKPVDVTKRHACHAKRRSLSPSARPATQTAAATTAANRTQARNQSQPSARSTTPPTQSEGRCRQAPGLPRKGTVDVTKCHACHAK